MISFTSAPVNRGEASATALRRLKQNDSSLKQLAVISTATSRVDTEPVYYCPANDGDEGLMRLGATPSRTTQIYES